MSASDCFRGGYGYGAPVVSSGGGIGFGEILVLGVFAVIAFQVISSLTNGSGESFGAPSLSTCMLFKCVSTHGMDDVFTAETD